MSDPLHHGKCQATSESVRVLRRMGRKGIHRGGAVRDDIYSSETKFWSSCKLNRDGTRSTIPRDKGLCSDAYVVRKITPAMIQWLRENT